MRDGDAVPSPGTWPGSSKDYPSILVVDDDLGTRETFSVAIEALGTRVLTAQTGREALAIASSVPLAFALIDWRLPDLPGTDLLRAINKDGRRVPFVLMSAYLSTPIVVEAMKLGANDVLDKPIDIDEVCRMVAAALWGPASISASKVTPPSTATAMRPRSAAERWALLVAKGCQSDGDLKTLEDWARFVGVSYSSLTESCRLIGISPHDARDLMRVLRAGIESVAAGCPPEMLLDVSDGGRSSP